MRSIQASNSQKRDVKKSVFQTRFVKFENFMQGEWGEEKFLKSILGDKMMLRF